jgi:hypothetical protein
MPSLTLSDASRHCCDWKSQVGATITEISPRLVNSWLELRNLLIEREYGAFRLVSDLTGRSSESAAGRDVYGALESPI